MNLEKKVLKCADLLKRRSNYKNFKKFQIISFFIIALIFIGLIILTIWICITEDYLKNNIFYIVPLVITILICLIFIAINIAHCISIKYSPLLDICTGNSHEFVRQWMPDNKRRNGDDILINVFVVFLNKINILIEISINLE